MNNTSGKARELPTAGIDELALPSFVVKWPAAAEATSPAALASGLTPIRLYEIAIDEWILFDEANYRQQPRRVVPAIP